MNHTNEHLIALPETSIKTNIVVFVNSILAFCMNLFSFVSLIVQPKLRRNKYYRVVMALSIGDMGASVCGVHWYVRRFLVKPDMNTDTECFLSFITVCTSLQQTHLQLVLIALERYLASKSSHRSNGYCSTKLQAIYFVCSWAFCAAYVTINSIYHKNNGANMCLLGQFSWFAKSNSDVGTVFVIPIIICLILVLVLYSLTIANIRRSSKRVMDLMHVSSQATSSQSG